MKVLKNTLLLGIVCALVSLPLAAQVDTGTADFTVYASIGDSLTAGFSSGSLHGDGQALSYPALISLQARGPVPFVPKSSSKPFVEILPPSYGLLQVII